MLCEINLSGHSVIFDDFDRVRFAARRWRIQKSGNVYYVITASREALLFHRFLLGAVHGQIVDHIDGNGLNNSRANLRFCSHAENMRNRKKHKNGKRPEKGVEVTKRGKFRARITLNGRKYSLGTYTNLEEARFAYANGAKSLHGEFARV